MHTAGPCLRCPLHKVQLSSRNPHLIATILAWVSGGPSHRQRIAECLIQTLLTTVLAPFFLFVVVVVWLCFTLVRVCGEKSSRPWCTCEHQVFIATQVVVAPSSACLAIIIIKSLTLQKLRLQMCFSLVIVNHWPLTSDFTCDERAACVNSNSAKLDRASTFQCAKVVAYEHFQRLWQVQVAIWLPSPFVLLWALAGCLAPETCKSTTSALAIASTDTLGEHLQCTAVALRFYRRSSIEK